MKQSLLKILLLVGMLHFTGCITDDVDIENNRRILVQGRLVDSEGNPLPNISIITSANNDPLGQTQSDASGNFELLSLDEQIDPLDIFINVDNFYNDPIDYDYASHFYLSAVHNNRLLYDLETIILGKRAELDVAFNNVPGDDNSLTYTIKFTPANCELPLTVLDPPENCDLGASIDGNFDLNSENRTLYIESVLGTTVLIEYSLNFAPVQTIEIPLTDLETNYVFEY